MASDHEIGRVVAVDTAQVTVELNSDLKALTRSTYEGTLEVGRINSYIVIPVGVRRIVAMVTRVVLTEESELKADKTMVSLPSSRRLMKATMIGTIDEGSFRQGINLFPVLDSIVLMTTREDLDAIFGKENHLCAQPDPERPGYCIPVGRSAIFPDYEIKIDPDAFFGKHAAVIGSTGSGKSCTIATILQSIIEQSDVLQTRFIILDTNGEYRAAFQRQHTDGTWVDASPDFKPLYIPTDPSEPGKLVIPYWFMDSDDFVRLFKASPGVQRPVLLNALATARDAEGGIANWCHIREDIVKECNRILSLSSGTNNSDAKTIRQICDGMNAYLDDASTTDGITALIVLYPSINYEMLKSLFSSITSIAREGIRNENQQYESYATIDANKRRRIEYAISPIMEALASPDYARRA